MASAAGDGDDASESGDEGSYCIVLDTGSGLLKAGYSSETEPRAVVQTITGVVKDTGGGSASSAAGGAGGGAGVTDGDGDDDPTAEETSTVKAEVGVTYVGADAVALRDQLILSRPMQRGEVTDWNAIEALWEYTFKYNLGLDLEEEGIDCNVLLAEQPGASTTQREKTAELLFERFDVPGCFLHSGPVLSLYALGHTTGIVLECGDGVTNAVPVYDGFTIDTGVRNIQLGGRDVTEHLVKVLLEQGVTLSSSSADWEVARLIKEAVGYVHKDAKQAESAKKAATSSEEFTTCTLPDGTSYKVGSASFRCAEVLFQPSMIGHESDGVSQSIENSIAACPVDLRRDLYKHVVLSGGSTLFQGFKDRVQADLRAGATYGTTVGVVAPPDRGTSVYQGGCVVGGLSTFQNKWVTRDEYEEEGKSRVLAKCVT